MLLKKSVVAIMLLNCLLQASAQAPKFSGRFSPVIDDNINGFWEYLPRNYTVDAPKRYPLLIFIHGSGEQGSTQDMTTLSLVLRNGPPKIIQAGTFPDSFNVNGTWFKFIVLCPQIKVGLYGIWNIVAPSTIEALITYAKTAYRVDTTRIYLTGLSMGGGTTWDYAGSSVSAASRLAAIVVACGAADVSPAKAYSIGRTNLPVLTTHNWDDPVVAAIRTAWNVDTIVTTTPNIRPMPRSIFWPTGGHNVWTRTFEQIKAGSTSGGNVTDTLGMNVYNWMLQFSRLQLALPVSWQAVSLEKRGQEVVINWILNNQESVKEFNVQRSEDAKKWMNVSAVAPIQQKQNVQYNYVDALTPTSKLFYRIVAVDLDGKTDYSPIRELDQDITGRMVVYPNPFVHQLSIDLPATNETAFTVRIADGSGRFILSKQIMASNHSLMIDDAERLPAGLYCISILSRGKQVYRQTVLKQ